MEVEEGTGNGGGTECSEGLYCLKSDGIDNRVKFGIGSSDVAGWGSVRSQSFRTYKRRKHVKFGANSKWEDEGRDFTKEDPQMVQEPRKEQGEGVAVNSCEKICLPRNCSDGCSQNSWKVVLEHMYQSLSDDEGGVQKFICNVLQSCPETSSKSRVKESDRPDECREMCNLILKNGFQNETSGHLGVLPKGRLDSLSTTSTTELCRHAWFHILISEKFTSLCKLLCENFQGIKIERFFDLRPINSRMKDGVYDHSPMLFLTDIQQVWEKIQGIGAEMISLAEDLSDMSRSCCDKQFHIVEPDSHTKLEEGEDYCAFRVCTCRRCGDKADGRDSLVCDLCEEMYHVSCIEPAVEEIPPKSWYCSSCTKSGIRLPHVNCVVCERLNVPKTALWGIGNDSSGTEDETHNEYGENSDCPADEIFQVSSSSNNLGICKICERQIEDGEMSRVCGHNFCPNKYYHVQCLAKKQLKSYGRCWYCPSCLCRSCLIDKDDDQIVLCDGCDHGYHIYCTEPKLTEIPSGSWYCRSCDGQLAKIQRARKAFEKSEKKQKKKASEGFGPFGVLGKNWNSKSCVEQDEGGGMEMLLTAVNTLNYEEKLGETLNG